MPALGRQDMKWMLTRLLYALVVVFGLAHCGTDRMIVQITNIPAHAKSLALTVTINGQAETRAPIQNPGSTQDINLKLPPGTEGEVVLDVDALLEDSHRVAWGNARYGLSSARVLPGHMYVAMTVLEVPDVRVQVEYLDSEGRLQIEGQTCAKTAQGRKVCTVHVRVDQRVRITAEPNDGYVVDWDGACEGEQTECEVAGSAATTIRLRPRVCSQTGWCWENHHLTGNGLWSIWGSTEKDVWAVGANGTLLHHDGRTWELQRSLSSNALYGVWGLHEDDVWAVGMGGHVQRYHNGRWLVIPTPTAAWIWRAWGASADDVWLTSGAGLLHWDGQQIRLVEGVTAGRSLYGLWGNSAQDVWAAGFGNQLFHFDGTTWQTHTAPPEVETGDYISSIWGVDARHVWMATSRGTILFWDGTQILVARSRPTTKKPDGTDAVSHYFRSIWGTGVNDVWVGGPDVLHWNGERWQEQPATAVHTVNAGWALDSTHWVVGPGGYLARYRGEQWQVVNGLDRRRRTKVWGTGKDDVWMIGDSGLVKHWNGRLWTTVDVGAKSHWTDIWGSGTTDIWLVGMGPAAVRHFDGSTWSSVDLKGMQENTWLTGVWGSGPKDVCIIAAGSSDSWRWDGQSWSPYDTGLTYGLHGIWGADSSNVWGVGPLGVIARWDARAKSWSPAQILGPTGEGPMLIDIWGSSVRDIYVGGTYNSNYGVSVVGHFDGNTWTVQHISEGGGMITGAFGFDKDHVYLSGNRVWTRTGDKWEPLAPDVLTGIGSVWGASPDELWAVGHGGEVLRYNKSRAPLAAARLSPWGN